MRGHERPGDRARVGDLRLGVGQRAPVQQLGHQHGLAAELHVGGRDHEPVDPAQRAPQLALGRRLVLEVELVERGLADLAQDRAGVHRAEHLSQRRGEHVEQGEVIANGAGQPGSQDLDRDRCAVAHAAMDLGAGRHRERLAVELVEDLAVRAAPRALEDLLDVLERDRRRRRGAGAPPTRRAARATRPGRRRRPPARRRARARRARSTSAGRARRPPPAVSATRAEAWAGRRPWAAQTMGRVRRSRRRSACRPTRRRRPARCRRGGEDRGEHGGDVGTRDLARGPGAAPALTRPVPGSSVRPPGGTIVNAKPLSVSFLSARPLARR